MFGTQEVACHPRINTALPKKSADIKHLGAATAVCVYTDVSGSLCQGRCHIEKERVSSIFVKSELARGSELNHWSIEI